MSVSAHLIDEVEPEVLQEHEKEQMLLTHLSQIKYIAQRMIAKLPASVELNDLISEGVLGLLDALEKFDPSRGVKFNTYAETRIRGAMLDSLRNLDWVPRSVRKRSKDFERTAKALEQRLGRPASENEIADELGISMQRYYARVEILRGLSLRSFGQTRDETANKREIEQEAVPECRCGKNEPFFYVHHGELQTILAEALARLPKRERLVMSLYYDDELTMREIGRVLGVKESRVSQCHTHAKARLLAHLGRLNLRRESL